MATATVALALTACSHDAYLVATLVSGDTAFSDVTAVEVSVSAPGRTPKILSPDFDATRYPTFDTHTGPRLSIAFTPDSPGPVDLVVTVKSASNPCLGQGRVEGVALKRADTTRIEVKVLHVVGACPAPGEIADAGVDGADGRVTFPGCEPAAPASCPASQSCYVDCVSQAATCVAAGARGPGERCASNDDCAPGNECFDYSGISGCGASTKLCMKFCGEDGDCASAGADAAGTSGAYAYPGGACSAAVECGGGVVTSYRRCSFACDPRGDGRTGCPDGLLCFLFRGTSGNDAPDCGCKDPSRTGTDGTICVSSVNCAPGFICNQTGTTRTCRQLCQPSSPTDCSGKSCTPLSNDSAGYGVCL